MNNEYVNHEIEDWKMYLAAVSCRVEYLKHGHRKMGKGPICMIVGENTSRLNWFPVEKKDGYAYSVLGDDGVIIVDYEEECEHLIIPSRIDGKRVLAVGRIMWKESVKKVTVEEGILQLCYGFLESCENLETVELPANLVRIAGEFCMGSRKIREFIVNGQNGSITAENGVLYDCSKRILLRYPAAGPDKIFRIPDKVRFICERAFGGCSLEKIIVPDGMEVIGRHAFMGGAAEVILPDSLTRIEKQAFWGCCLKKIEIPNSVTYMGERAFAYCTSLKEIKMPVWLEEFGTWMFQECDSLEKVWLPAGIRRLEGTFHECRALKHVYIPPTVMEIDDTALNRDDKEFLTGATIYGVEGSMAYYFAHDNGFQWIDVNEL